MVSIFRPNMSTPPPPPLASSAYLFVVDFGGIALEAPEKLFLVLDLHGVVTAGTLFHHVHLSCRSNQQRHHEMAFLGRKKKINTWYAPGDGRFGQEKTTKRQKTANQS